MSKNSFKFDIKYRAFCNGRYIDIDTIDDEKLAKLFVTGQRFLIVKDWTKYTVYTNDWHELECISLEESSEHELSKKTLRAKHLNDDIDTLTMRFLDIIASYKDVNKGRVKTRKGATLSRQKMSEYNYYINQCHDEDGYIKALERIGVNWKFASDITYGLTNKQ